MNVEEVLILINQIVRTKTGKDLTDLQTTILEQVWQGKKYLEIADEYGCTEGHAKDVGSLLWKILSEELAERINKNNFKSVLKRYVHNKNLNQIEQGNLEDIKGDSENNNQLNYDINFVGRNQNISDLNLLINHNHKIIVIQGKGGVGKTTLAQQYLSGGNFEVVLEFLMAKEEQNIISVESLVEEWLKRDLQEEPGKEFGVTLARLKRQLKQRKIGILIDNLEPALDQDGKFILSHRNYVELLRVLADKQVQGVTLITSRDRICEGDLNLKHYRLSGLNFSAWSDFFRLNKLTIIASILQKIHFIYGGNAKAMGIISGVIEEDFAGDLKAYWRENEHNPLVETDLKNLVASQFERIKKLDGQAYILLCRLGAYRYQDIPTISRHGLLSLLWDLETSNPRKIIESLRRRSLIEFSQGNYWLHPIIKAEALSRLESIDNNLVHQHIAQFYTKSVARIQTIQDGLTALEAYYHYLTIEDYDAAARVILQSRDNQWGQYLTLGSTLYRLGLLQPLLTAIPKIIDRVDSEKYRSELNNILGDVYWISGKIKQAKVSQQATITTASNWLNNISLNSITQQDLYYWKMLQVDSLLSIGLYNIDLWELEEAAILFQKVIDISQNTRHHSWSEKATICLALVQSHCKYKPEIYQSIQFFIEAIVSKKNSTYNTGRFAYFIQILGQTLINLNQIELAKTMFARAIAFAEEINYVQVRANSLIGLAIIYRQYHNFDLAQTYHQEAIKLLENIGAKYDLAESYFQFAITLKKAKNLSQSKLFFQQAVTLFQHLEAVKQVLKVKPYYNE